MWTDISIEAIFQSSLYIMIGMCNLIFLLLHLN